MPGIPRLIPAAVAAAALAAAFAAPSCQAAEDAPAKPRLRVMVATALQRDLAPAITLTGDVEPRYTSDLSFRAGGKIATRAVEVGQHVAADQVLATIDPAEQTANLQNARAALASAQALLTQAQLGFARQKSLMGSGYTTRSAFDNAEQSLRVTQASVDSAQAALGTAEEQLGFTELRSGVAGIVTARDAEVGQVVGAGTRVFTLAQDGPRDAVFNVYEALLVEPPKGGIAVALQSDPSVVATGTVREISPTVDPASGTVRVKVALAATPPRMSLGATVLGTGRFRPQRGITLPWSALFRQGDGPAVWVLGRDGTVSLHPVTVARYLDDAMVLSSGVEAGQRVVTAGIQFLRPGQAVDAVEGGAP
ncbi:efflux RND transporter periplasmic adaptor subunit [Lichenibacterium minor]|uniref:Efflux RND transporter periplasmic adaptor subunit n=1 Tax=Lichenibacterium minor TaxID=2316528 RepID=A0A4V1RUT3_9HYPH|nr:efflux RND transporter periplasmic adaptor subunit [Lichenibacterium minor]RYC32254.1 efflux RND transporter periplasmic adaptor subunit [Lichenibacterium minor]